MVLHAVIFKEKIFAKKYELETQKSKFRPTLDLSLSANRMTDEEDYVTSENTYKAEITFKYNFYNGGKDENNLLKIYSQVKEIKYKMQEELRKLKWSLSKLYTSVNASKTAMKSTQLETIASKNMVDAYWESFKLGEQDLQVLLQGQKQLNSAELEYVNYKQSNVNDYLSILVESGDLLSFFDIDVNRSEYIDFSRSAFRNSI